MEELLITRSELVNQSPFRKRIALRKSSSYYESVKKWNRESPENFFAVALVDEDLTPEAIMEQVSLGTYDYALVDSHLYEVGKGFSKTSSSPLYSHSKIRRKRSLWR